MARALALAEARLGRTAPNPSVGCVLAAGGVRLAEAATGAGGRPHAEEQALGAAGAAARGASAYVTLEPCGTRSSGGPSCADLLIGAGVARVVCAIEDPHPHGAGGLERLRGAGVEVVVGVMRAQAELVNAGFFTLTRTGRPLVAIDARLDRYDAAFTRFEGESLAEALERMGRAGLTRVAAAPGGALAEALVAAGLVTRAPGG